MKLVYRFKLCTWNLRKTATGSTCLYPWASIKKSEFSSLNKKKLNSSNNKISPSKKSSIEPFNTFMNKLNTWNNSKPKTTQPKTSALSYPSKTKSFKDKINKLSKLYKNFKLKNNNSSKKRKCSPPKWLISKNNSLKTLKNIKKLPICSKGIKRKLKIKKLSGMHPTQSLTSSLNFKKTSNFSKET